MPSRKRRNGGRKASKEETRSLGDRMLSCLCGVLPRVVEDDPPLCSAEEFRAMHYRKHMKGQQIQTVGPVHWLHPRAIMIATLYDSIVICPGAPKALLECLLFHKTLIRYEDYPPAEQRITTSYSEESPEAADHEAESVGVSAAEGASSASAMSVEDLEALERPESAGNAACCLNDTFEEDELEAAALAEEMDQQEADLAAIHAVLGSPFVQRDAMRQSEPEEFTMSASPKKQASKQAVIKLTATSAASNSPVARALFQPETQEERRQRFKTASKRADTDCARAAERASNVASAVADSAAVAAAVATANAPPKKTPETLLDTMSTETGERAAQAAEEKSALETVIEDTQAELAKLQRSKVASMIRLYQGMDSPQHASPKISACHSPQPLVKLQEPLIPSRKASDSFTTQDGSKKGYTTRYLSAVQAATNTVSSWLQKGDSLDADGSEGVPSPVAAAAAQLRDEQQRPIRKTTEDMRMPMTPMARRQADALTFSTPSANLYEENDHSLWSSSFTSDLGAPEVNPEKAAKHAAAAARKALEAAQHAHRAAMYAGLLPKNGPEAEPWRMTSKYLDTATTDSGMATFHNLLFEPAF